jgi:hypothetical protein
MRARAVTLHAVITTEMVLPGVTWTVSAQDDTI